MTAAHDLWTDAVRRSAAGEWDRDRSRSYDVRTGRVRRNDHARTYEPACGFTPREEDKVHDLMGRAKRGTLTRECLSRALDDARKALGRANGDADLGSLVKIYGHVLRYGEFKRRLEPYGSDGLDGTRDGRDGGDGRDGARRNAQLQIIENPGKGKRNDDEAPKAPPAVQAAVEKFHGTSDGDLVLEYQAGGKKDEGTISLAYLGRCPFVAWLADDKGCKEHAIKIEDETVRFLGQRLTFSGNGRPYLGLRVDTKEAVIVGPGVERLKERAKRGVLGLAPVVEYVAEDVEGTSKGEDIHYVHEFGLKRKGAKSNGKDPGVDEKTGINPAIDPKTLPRLEWDDEIDGFVYRGGEYVVSDWFHR